MNSYDPKEYWSMRGKSYYLRNFNTQEYRLQEDLLIKTLKQLTFRSVLEVGCGFGRITRLVLSHFSDIEEYTALDLSSDQINNAKKYLQGLKPINFLVSDIMSIPETKQYDLVLASEVLLHVRPKELQNTIIKLLTLSKHYLVHVDWQEESPPPAAEHNFMHDYDSIYQQLHSKYEKIFVKQKKAFGRTIDAKQAFFIIKK